jgi:trehalose-6-phosphate synthase
LSQRSDAPVRRKLIVVSNRGPVTFAPDGSARRSSGGLATALRSLISYHDVTWIASAIGDGDRARAGETMNADGYRLHLVAHDAQAYDWYYNVVANPMLWFVHHSLWELAYTPKVDTAFHRAWPPSSASSRPSPTQPSSSTTTTCTSRRGSSETSVLARR